MTNQIEKTKLSHRTLIYKALVAVFLTLISLLLLSISHSYAGFSDLYSASVYTFLVNTLGRISGLFPFSVVELLLYINVIFWPIYLIRTIFKRRLYELFKFVANLLLFISVLFLSYTLDCGINYGCTSFATTEGIESISYTVNDLTDACLYLTEEINALATDMNRTDDGTLILTENVQASAVAAMKNLGKLYPSLCGYYPNPKALLFSYILSVQQLAGVYSPFTIEANYNSDMATYHQPFTACHELSHLRGYMLEDESNFIAFLACINSDDAELRYSGYMVAWVYTTNQLYTADKTAYQNVYAKLCDEAKVDLSANNAFWSQYKSKVSEVSTKVNDSYLKANGQSEGVISYDRVVELIMSYLSLS